MTWENWFSLANTVALASWAALILLPRWPWLRALLRYGVPTAFAIGYTALIALYALRIEGGGFNSLAQVKALLGTEPTLLAGWLHYLTFDLFVGVWIAERADYHGLSRLLQVPILALTFLFGPIGYLVFVAIERVLPSWQTATSEATS